MKELLFFLLLTSTNLFASKHEMKLTFIDGYSNQKITNKEVVLRIVKPNFSQTFITDNNGSISFSFKSGKEIEYQFEFTSGDFELQTRQRYFGNDKNADITFYIYPTKKYEEVIKQKELELMSQFEEIWGDSICPSPFFPEGSDAIQSFVYSNLQTPYNYGDFGFEAHFKIEFILGPDAKPYLLNILESTDENLNMEAIRLIRAMPKWIIENCDGKNYKRKMTLNLDIDLGM